MNQDKLTVFLLGLLGATFHFEPKFWTHLFYRTGPIRAGLDLLPHHRCPIQKDDHPAVWYNPNPVRCVSCPLKIDDGIRREVVRKEFRLGRRFFGVQPIPVAYKREKESRVFL